MKDLRYFKHCMVSLHDNYVGHVIDVSFSHINAVNVIKIRVHDIKRKLLLQCNLDIMKMSKIQKNTRCNKYSSDNIRNI